MARGQSPARKVPPPLAPKTKEKQAGVRLHNQRALKNMSNKYTAQDFYDARRNFACISGKELHEFFSATCGDPSPKGATPITIAAMMDEDAPYTFELLKALKSVTRQQRRDLRRERGW